MMRSRLIATILAVTLLHCGHAVPMRGLSVPPLSGGASSPEALVDELLLAIASNDPTALHALRVSEVEYRTIIVPGTVEVGQPLREVDAAATTAFWRLLDSKSRDFGRQLLADQGGKKLSRKEIRFTKGVHPYAGYTAHGQVRVLVTDAQANETLIRSGTIAQVGDRYKFISLSWDD